MAAKGAYCSGKSANDAKQKSAKMRKLIHQRERKRMAKSEFSAMLNFMFAFYFLICWFHGHYFMGFISLVSTPRAA